MQRVRICHLITELAPAGAERMVYELARRLDRGRFDVQVAALRGGAVADWLSEAGIKTTVLDVRGKWDIARAAKLVGLLRRERIDILHTHLFHADLVGRLAAWRVGSIRLVHTVHTAEARWRPWQFAFTRRTDRLCDRIVAVSESARDHHARLSRLPHSKYTVIPNGIDPAEFARDENTRRQLRAEWGLADDDVLAATVGRLSEEKGVETLLAAMRELAASHPGLHLVLAGDGPLRAKAQRYIDRHLPAGRVRLLGYVSDVRGVLSAADLLAMPSRWEGFGLSAAEAMAAELPVVASDVPGLRDLVVDGQTGLLIPADNPAALADALRTLSGDAELRLRLGQAGRHRIQNYFHISATVSAHEALYGELS